MSEFRPMRILVVGAGVIGSVYAGRLAARGHEVTLMARGRRLADLHEHGLLLEDAASGRRTALRLPVTEAPSTAARFDLAVVPVRREQLDSTVDMVRAIDTDAVLYLGNTVSRVADLSAALRGRALFGFPAAGGARQGPLIRYVTIRQQRTMLAEPSGTASPRLRRVADAFGQAGFPTHVSPDPEGWLLAHAAFVVPIAFALYRVGVEPTRLAGDADTVRLMVRATRQAFRALQQDGDREIPRNLRALYLALPESLAVRYWRRVLAGPRGELWFAAHTRTARDEMVSVAGVLDSRVNAATTRAPALIELIGG